MKLTPARIPKELDQTITTGPNKGKTFRAIYDIDDDQHRVCFTAPGKERLAEFSSQTGDGRVLQIWKRVK